MKNPIWKTLAAPLLAMLTMQASASAQCLTPDRLDGGPCCTPTQPQHPSVQRIRQDALSICWKDCDVENVVDCTAEWRPTSSSLSPCAIKNMSLRLRDGAGITKWRGKMSVQYARTWMETGPTGSPIQVWRYLTNGDLIASSAVGPDPCPLPPCALAHNRRVRYTGYIDMAIACQPIPGAPARSYSWMLTHACDMIDHQPGFPRAGSFHPDRTYSFVGPAAGFVPTAMLPVEAGASDQEAVRRVDLSGGPPVCLFEERIDYSLDPVNQFCLCGPTAAPAQYVFCDLALGGACGTGINSGGPFLPGYISMAVGRWTDPLTFPGEEMVRWNAAGYQYADPCVPAVRPEVFFGVTTMRGYPAQTIPSVAGMAPMPLLPTFIDQCNSQRSGNTVMNLRWRRSDHFVHLNLP